MSTISHYHHNLQTTLITITIIAAVLLVLLAIAIPLILLTRQTRNRSITGEIALLLATTQADAPLNDDHPHTR